MWTIVKIAALGVLGVILQYVDGSEFCPSGNTTNYYTIIQYTNDKALIEDDIQLNETIDQRLFSQNVLLEILIANKTANLSTFLPGVEENRVAIADMKIRLEQFENSQEQIYKTLNAEIEIFKLNQSRINEIINNKIDTLYARSAHYPSDCYDVLKAGNKKSGTYMIRPGSEVDPFEVYCEHGIDGGGWTVITNLERHVGSFSVLWGQLPGTIDFYKNWEDYKWGFGNLSTEFWLGLENIYSITRRKQYTLRIDLEDFDSLKNFAVYTNFSIASEADNYRLQNLGTYSGTAGNPLFVHLNQAFATKDKYNAKDCLRFYKGAWWYRQCYNLSLHDQDSMMKTMMMVRPSD